jgi:hypothetical protein
VDAPQPNTRFETLHETGPSIHCDWLWGYFVHGRRFTMRWSRAKATLGNGPLEIVLERNANRWLQHVGLK